MMFLRQLKERNPDFSDYHETLLKVLAVNEFYGAGCSNIGMSEHLKHNGLKIIERYKSQNNADGCIELVEAIALPEKYKDKGGDGCAVFASKFACFFIDEQVFPILDTHTERMVQFHLGQRNLCEKEVKPPRGQRYKAFYTQFFQMEEKIHMQGSTRTFSNKELDHYLWLAGITETLIQDPEAKVNGDVKKKFHHPATHPLFEKLFPYKNYRSS